MLEKSKGAINNGHTETLTYKTPDEENREREKNHTSTKNANKDEKHGFYKCGMPDVSRISSSIMKRTII